MKEVLGGKNNMSDDIIKDLLSKNNKNAQDEKPWVLDVLKSILFYFVVFSFMFITSYYIFNFMNKGSVSKVNIFAGYSVFIFAFIFVTKFSVGRDYYQRRASIARISNPRKKRELMNTNRIDLANIASKWDLFVLLVALGVYIGSYYNL